MVHMTKTLALQLGPFGITVNCIHPGTTRTERTPGMLEARAKELGITAEEVEQRDFATGSPGSNAIGRMVDADEVAYVTTFLASDKAWAISGELIVATGGAGSSSTTRTRRSAPGMTRSFENHWIVVRPAATGGFRPTPE